jgi:hypothetical protein
VAIAVLSSRIGSGCQARLPAPVLVAAQQRGGQSPDGTGAAPRSPSALASPPVATASGQLTLAVVRDISGTARLGDLAALAWDAGAAQQEHVRLGGAVISGLFRAGLSLQAAVGLPADAARLRIEAVLGELDDIIRQIRSAAFNERTRPGPAPPHASGDAR